jgi:hypothetical protein
MGLLDLPAPLFDWLDRQLADLIPPAARILLWALLGAAIATELYRLISPQARIAAAKVRLREAQQRLADYDGEFADAWPLMGNMLRLALRRIGLVFPAAMVSSLALLSLIAWLDSRFSLRFPDPGQTVEVHTSAPGFQAQWLEGIIVPHVVVTDDRGSTVADVPVTAPVDRIHKRRWWNALLGNPAGYLPMDAAVDRIDIAVPAQELLEIGPPWLRGWEVIFFASLLLGTLGFHHFRRIQ